MKGKGEKEPIALSETQLLEASKVAYAFESIMRDDYPSFKDYREVITKIFVDSKRSALWLDKLIKLEEDGVYIWEVPGLMSAFRKHAALQYQTLRSEPPNLSGVGLMHFSGQQQRQSRAFVVDNIFSMGTQPGCAGVVYGVPGAGKSDITVNEIIRTESKKQDIKINGNIPISNPPHNYDYNVRLSTTLRNMALHTIEGLTNSGKPYPTSRVYDEGQFGRNRKRATSNRNLWEEQMTVLSRKFGCFQWLLYQQNKPPSEIADFATHWIDKPSLTHLDYADLRITSPKVKCSMKLKGIMGWEQRMDAGLEYYEFQSYSPDVYQVDINPLRMIDYVTGLSEGKEFSTIERFENIVKYIDSHKGERLDIISDDVIAVLLYRIRNKFINCGDKFDEKVASYAYLGKMVGWPRTTTRDRIKKVEQDIADGLLVPDHTDDVIKDLSGAVDLPISS